MEFPGRPDSRRPEVVINTGGFSWRSVPIIQTASGNDILFAVFIFVLILFLRTSIVQAFHRL
jgi:hypothetical protein